VSVDATDGLIAESTLGPDLGAEAVERTLEASAGQRLLWLLDHYRGQEGRVNVPLGWRITEPLDEAALAAALDDLCIRHEALRTTYGALGRRLMQTVHGARSFDLRSVSAPAIGADEVEGALSRVRSLARRNLDAARSPVQAALWRLGPADHLLLLNIHHLATDFFSGAVIARDLEALYELRSGLATAPLPPVQWQYADWSEWQRERFAAGRLEQLQGFWRERLAGARLPQLHADAAPSTPGPDPSPAGTVGELERGTVQLDFEPGTSAALRAAARSLRSTLFPVMLAVFFGQLHRVSGERDLTIASLFTNRRPEVRESVGFFVNMVALRALVDPDAAFATLARTARGTVMQALANCELPIQMLPATALPGGGRVDDVVFQFLEAPAEPPRRRRFEPIDVAVPAGRFALELVVRAGDQCMLRFDPERFDTRWAMAFLDGYGRLLAAACNAPERSLAELLEPLGRPARGAAEPARASSAVAPS
jgi:hypothetical protein